MSSEQRVRTPRPDGGCHQCRTSPSLELVRRGLEQMCARASSGAACSKRANVLELISVSEGAAGLVEARCAHKTRPDNVW